MFSSPLFYLLFAIYLLTNADFFSTPVYAQSATSEEERVKTDEDDNSSKHQFIVKLNPSAQKTAGLKTLILPISHYQAERLSYGRVVTIQPLLEIRKRYFLAQSEQSSAKAKFNQAQQSIMRLQDLYNNQVVSKRQIQSQKSKWQVDKAQFNAVHFQLKAIYAESLVRWGRELTDKILSDSKEDALAGFITGQQHLLEITLPAGQILADSVTQIIVSPSGDRQQGIVADFISISPHTGEINQGNSYFFVSQSPLLKTGMQISAWLPEHQNAQQGVIIPKSAVFWHMGQTFVYVKSDDDEFTRIAIPRLISTPTGYFNQHQLKPDDELVITGAQMLLSEEFRALIPDEDDDD